LFAWTINTLGKPFQTFPVHAAVEPQSTKYPRKMRELSLHHMLLKVLNHRCSSFTFS
jgi:hypothetical protein